MKNLLLAVVLGIVAMGRPSGLHSPAPLGAHCLIPRPVVMAQEGNPGHREPPPGWTCANQANTPADHRCACHRECKDTPTENPDGSQGTTTTVVEDPKCRVYCFQDHCQCGVKNCE